MWELLHGQESETARSSTGIEEQGLIGQVCCEDGHRPASDAHRRPPESSYQEGERATGAFAEPACSTRWVRVEEGLGRCQSHEACQKGQKGRTRKAEAEVSIQEEQILEVDRSGRNPSLDA